MASAISGLWEVDVVDSFVAGIAEGGGEESVSGEAI